MRKFLAVVLVLSLLGALSASASAMETTVPPPERETSSGQADVSARVGPHGEVVVSEVSDGGSPGSGSGRSGGGSSNISCVDLDDEYGNTGEDRVGVDDDFVDPVIDPNLYVGGVVGASNAVFDPEGDFVPVSGRLYSPSGKWRYLDCRDTAGNIVQRDLIPIGGQAVTLGELGSRALGVLDPPVPGVTANPEGKQLVQFPSLFWVEPAYWDAVRVDTQTAGRVSLTMALVPFESEWDPGDGNDPVVCDGPGEVWEEGLDGNDFYCQHTYKTVKGQPFTLTSTVRFRVEVTTNAPEVLAPPAITRETTQELGVREIQIVESNA